jgi:hypothetical protein
VILGTLGAACGGAQSGERYVEPTVKSEPLIDAESTEVHPSYGRADMERVLAEERRALAEGQATAEALMLQKGKAVELSLALADLSVQRRYIEAMESCRDHGVWCPPRLGLTWTLRDGDVDVPVSLDAEQRFDLESWRKLTRELWARGCDCRSMRCVDAMTRTVDVLEARPTAEVQGDHEASVALTGARTCLWRLRGKAGKRALAPL